jgi:ubiquinone/menaquinone biosynthesis C-methylase UbiE
MTKRQNCLAEGFRDVDSQDDAGKFKTALAFMDTLPSFRTYKEETEKLMRLGQGRAFADIGCGLGFDVERMAAKTTGVVVGLDTSFEFLKEARRRAQARGLRTVNYVLEDARAMSFRDEKFDGARADRVLQHVEEPDLVIEEMARIVRKGGRVVCAEPDWGTFFIDDDDAGCGEAVFEEWTRSIRNPGIGRKLPRLMKAAGLTNIEISGYLLATYGLRDVKRRYRVECGTG